MALVSREQTKAKVAELAAQIREGYGDDNHLLIGVLKGSFMFLSDLVWALDMPLRNQS